MIELRNIGFAVSTPNTGATYMDVVVTTSDDACVTVLNPTTRIFATSGNIFLDIDHHTYLYYHQDLIYDKLQRLKIHLL